MSLFLKVIGALAKGAGDYLVEKAKQDAQAARDALLFNRELALEAIETGNRREEMKLGSSLRKEETSHTAKENRVTNLQEGQITGALEETKDRRRQQFEVMFEKLKSNNRITEAQKDAALQLWVNDQTIDRMEPTADGRMVIWSKTGKSRIAGKPGSFLPPGGASGSDDDDLKKEAARLRGESGAGGGSTAAPTTPAPRNAIEAYDNATPETAPGLFRPDGTKIPRNEFMRLWNSEQ